MIIMELVSENIAKLIIEKSKKKTIELPNNMMNRTHVKKDHYKYLAMWESDNIKQIEIK